MSLAERLRERSGIIADDWFRRVLGTYPAAAAGSLGRENDPFANPVGHALRTGTTAVVEGLLAGRAAAELIPALDEIIKIRAVQEFRPSEAIGFVFLLKQAVRVYVEGNVDLGEFSSDLVDLERRIDEIALGAFDIYVRYRQQVSELRINEVTRRIGKFAERMDRRLAARKVEEERAIGEREPCAAIQPGGSP